MALCKINLLNSIFSPGLVPQKGLDVLVEALPRLSGAATAWPVTLVGDGPERDRLQSQAKDLGVLDQLQCLGFRSDPERFLAEAAVFVFALPVLKACPMPCWRPWLLVWP